MYINNVQLIGNLVDAPNVQVTHSGVVRARFRVASTERRRDPSTEVWQDGESVFVDVTCWRRLAQHVGNSLGKGDRVIVIGRLRQWIAERDGIRRTVLELEAEAVGPDLQRGMVTIARPRRVETGDGEPVVPVEAVEPGPGDVDLDTGEIVAGTDRDELVEDESGGSEQPEPRSLDAVFDAHPLADAAL